MFKAYLILLIAPLIFMVWLQGIGVINATAQKGYIDKLLFGGPQGLEDDGD